MLYVIKNEKGKYWRHPTNFISDLQMASLIPDPRDVILRREEKLVEVIRKADKIEEVKKVVHSKKNLEMFSLENIKYLTEKLAKKGDYIFISVWCEKNGDTAPLDLKFYVSKTDKTSKSENDRADYLYDSWNELVNVWDI